MSNVTPINSPLVRIQESTKKDSPTQIAEKRRVIARYVRELTAHANGNEMLTRFGSDRVSENAQRLARHQAELVYLDQLLQSLDPVMAAQVAAENQYDRVKALIAGKTAEEQSRPRTPEELRMLANDIQRGTYGGSAEQIALEVAYLNSLIKAQAPELLTA